MIRHVRPLRCCIFSMIVLSAVSCMTPGNAGLYAQKPLEVETPKTHKFLTYGFDLRSIERTKGAETKWGDIVITPSPQQEETFTFEDAAISGTAQMNPRRCFVSLKNKTSETAKIQWDEAVFVDHRNVNHRLCHVGVKLIDRNSPQLPTVIPAGTIHKDELLVSDNIIFLSGTGWRLLSLLPIRNPSDIGFHSEDVFCDEVIGSTPAAWKDKSILECAKQYVGRSFSVVLPIEIAQEEVDYKFTFEVTRVTEKESSTDDLPIGYSGRL